MLDALNAIGATTPLTAAKNAAQEPASSAKDNTSPFNTVEKHLADQVDISADFLSRLENLRNLERQLTRFADVMKGKRSAGSVLFEMDIEKSYPTITKEIQENGAKFSLPSARDFEATINATRERLFKTQASILESLNKET